MSRQLRKGFIEGFAKYFEGRDLPSLFVRMTAISCLVAALENRVWSYGDGGKSIVYPNLMVLFLSPSGGGKSPPIKLCKELWESIPALRAGADDLTGSAFQQELGDCRKLNKETGVVYEPIAIAAEEAVLLFSQGYDRVFAGNLIKAYDNTMITARRTTRGKISLSAPQINLIMGVQPKAFGTIFPDEAYTVGLMRRMLIMYSDEENFVEFFSEEDQDQIETQVEEDIALVISLRKDLESMLALHGTFIWELAAKKAFNKWWAADHERIIHPRMGNSYSRHRKIHITKLTMALSISRDDLLHITLGDFIEAKDLLYEIESTLPQVFANVAQENESIQIEATIDFVKTYVKNTDTNKIHESALISYLYKRIQPHKVHQYIDILVGARELIVLGDSKLGGRVFTVGQTPAKKEEK